MRRHAVILGIAMALTACSKKPELQPIEEPGRYKSKADVERVFNEMARNANATMPELTDRAFQYDSGSLVINSIKKTYSITFKGRNAGLWIKGPMDGTVDAANADVTMRFSGMISGMVRVGGGVVWLEQLPDDKAMITFRMEFKKPGVIVVNSATRAQLKRLQGCLQGGPLEVVAFESDYEPGRWASEWGRGSEGQAAVRGITKLTVFSKLPEASN